MTVPQNFPLYQPPRAHTEYAIIKFHDVGQEIDVWGGSPYLEKNLKFLNLLVLKFPF